MAVCPVGSGESVRTVRARRTNGSERHIQDAPTAPRRAHCCARFAYEKFHKVEVVDVVVSHEHGRSIDHPPFLRRGPRLVGVRLDGLLEPPDGVQRRVDDPRERVLDHLRGGLGGADLGVEVSKPSLQVCDAVHDGVGLVRDRQRADQPVDLPAYLDRLPLDGGDLLFSRPDLLKVLSAEIGNDAEDQLRRERGLARRSPARSTER
jgi:hypothetical protein